jgi:hypothetical protein
MATPLSHRREYKDDLGSPVLSGDDKRSRGPGSIPGATRFSEKCLERGPLSLVSTADELLGRKSSGSDLESREYGRRDPLR